jgi:hypothetical protein
VWIFVVRATHNFFFKKYQFKVSKKSKINSRYGQCWDLQTCKVSIQNFLYLRLHKNEKIWQILTFWKFTLFTITYVRFCYFCTSNIIRYFELKFCMFIDLNIVLIWNEEFKMHFLIFLNGELHVARATFIVFVVHPWFFFYIPTHGLWQVLVFRRWEKHIPLIN